MNAYKRVLKYALNKGSVKLKNWPYRIINHLDNINCSEYSNMATSISNFNMNSQVSINMIDSYKLQWIRLVTTNQSARGIGGNKLRNYKLFKNSWETEQFCRMIMPQSHRSAFAKFRSGVAPLRIETGRYESLRITERLFPFCRDCTEDEFHVLFKCPLYNELREVLFRNACTNDQSFDTYDETAKFTFLFSCPRMIRICAKTCFLKTFFNEDYYF